MKLQILALPATTAALLALSLASCKNSAEGSATIVGDAVTKTTDSAGGTKYVFTPESTVGFTGYKVTGHHDGGFKTFTGYFTVKDGKPVGNDHKVVIDMSTTFADDEKLTGHLKSPDFFDVAKFPQSTFDITEIKPQSDSKYTVTGNFTLHGVTKNISFPADVAKDGDNVKISSVFKINRKDFAINYPGQADNLIKDDVDIKLNLEAKPGA